MRRSTSPPYCHLETVIPVKHKKLNEKFKEVTVTEPYRFQSWWTAKDLPELIRKASYDIKQYGWKSDAKKGTVNGIPMRRIESDVYQDDQFTAKELNAPAGYRYWKCDPETKTVTLLRFWDHDIERLKKNRRRWKRIESDPRWLPPLTVPMPDGWEVTWSKTQQPDKSVTKTEIVSGWLEDRNTSPKITAAEAQEKLSGLLNGTVDWQIEDAFGWPNQENLVLQVFRKRSRISKDAKFWQITGKTFENSDSPKVLYRAMHYFAATKLDELYKGHLVRVYHPEGIAWCDIGTWKCEMEIRLLADKEHCKQVKPASFVQLGQPHESNTVKAPKFIRDWYDLLVKLLKTKTMIYSGNNFEV